MQRLKKLLGECEVRFNTQVTATGGEAFHVLHLHPRQLGQLLLLIGDQGAQGDVIVVSFLLTLNYGQEWLKANFEASKDELFEANKANLPLIRSMLEDVASDAAVLHMEKEDLIEDFLIAYQEALGEIGFTSRDIARMAAAALAV